MKMFSLIVHSILSLIGIGILTLCLLGILNIPEQAERDKEFIENRMTPAVDFVNLFYKENNALPTRIQFEVWKESKGWGNRALDLDQKNNQTGRFELSLWRGEWYENYQSWTDDYTADDVGYFYIALYLIIGTSLTYFGFHRYEKSIGNSY